jgi:hypothetical protein
MLNVTSSLQIKSARLVTNFIIFYISKSITVTLLPIGENNRFFEGLKQMFPDL